MLGGLLRRRRQLRRRSFGPTTVPPPDRPSCASSPTVVAFTGGRRIGAGAVLILALIGLGGTYIAMHDRLLRRPRCSAQRLTTSRPGASNQTCRARPGSRFPDDGSRGTRTTRHGRLAHPRRRAHRTRVDGGTRRRAEACLAQCAVRSPTGSCFPAAGRWSSRDCLWVGFVGAGVPRAGWAGSGLLVG